MFHFNEEDLILARGLLEDLKLPDKFGTLEEDYFDTEDFREYFKKKNDALKVDFFHGISKFVISIDVLPFVIKIPFNGYYESRYFEEDGEEWEEENFYYFHEANEDFDHCDDYCYDEYMRFKSLKENGFADFIPATQKLMRICGFDVYVQEKISTYRGTSCKKPTKDSFETAEFYTKNRHCGCLNSSWLGLLIDTCGVDKWYSFYMWVTKNMDDFFDDMHMDNYGFRADGSPVFLDISGFRDC